MGDQRYNILLKVLQFYESLLYVFDICVQGFNRLEKC